MCRRVRQARIVDDPPVARGNEPMETMMAIDRKETDATAGYCDEVTRWAAVIARDAGADGQFWYSVRTTGVYCRPSCKARLPRRENVAFHASPEAAERAGFRACKRCRPTPADGAGRVRYAVAGGAAGTVLVAASGRGVCAILPGEDAATLVAELRARFPEAVADTGDAAFALTLEAVLAFLDAPDRGFALPLDLRGTPFQLRVWEALRAIPAGTTASYADIARTIGRPSAVRAVARACAANMLALAVPCHRVVRADGSLSGYRWGVERKRALLAREAA